MQIREIGDIIRILQKYEDQTISSSAWRNLNEKDTNFAKFHRLVISGEGVSDNEAARQIFGKSFSPTRYRTLKTHYLATVIDSIPSLAISRSDLSEHSKAIFKAHKLLFYIRTLLFLGSRPAAIHFAKRLLKVAEKFELYSVTTSLLDEFRRYSMQLGMETDYSKYLKKSIRHTELLVSESAMKALEEQIFIHFPKSLFVDEKFIIDVRSSLNKAKLILKDNETYFNRLSYYRIEYITHQVEGKLLESAATCDRALEFMMSRRHMSPDSRLAEFALYKLENYILLRDYINGKKAASYCEKHIVKGMKLWFTFKEYEFLLMMQTMKFVSADRIYKEVQGHERFNSLAKHLQDRWQMFGFHIQYVMKSTSADPANDISFKKSYLMRNKEFKSRLLDFPTYRKDKKGFNVAILNLNILVALEENNLDLLIKQEDALSSYRFKYLNEKHCRQSFILFKLIRLMTKNGFDLKRIEKKASLFEKDLGIHKLKAGEIFEGIQILPPQWVWNRIKEILESRKKR
jgi:hypothetical protein